ncbi:MAG: hypothetical protein KC492_05855 [Myxococcales bacterium]|nr:hypothetical protein [Myxococcales bacterium]
MAYHTATTPSPRYPENYASQGKLVTSLSIALGVYVVLSLSLFIVQLWYALATNHVIQLTDDAAELLFVSGTTVHWLHDGFDAACCAVGLKFVQRASQNARVLGAFAMRFTPESSVDSFDQRNFFRIMVPARMMNELWAASGPEVEALSTPRFLVWWWPLFLVAKAIQVLGLVAGSSPDAAWWLAASQLLNIAVLYLSYRLLEGLHERQELRAMARAASKHRALSA